MKNLGNIISKASKILAGSGLATLTSAASIIGLSIAGADPDYIKLAGATFTGSYVATLISGIYLFDKIGKAVENKSLIRSYENNYN